MHAIQPTIALNTGVELPALGFGVFQTPPDVTQVCRRRSAALGVPHDRHRGVLQQRTGSRSRDRGERHCTVGPVRADQGCGSASMATTRALHGFDLSTRKLGLDTVDLYFLHQPLPQAFDLTVAAYRALERPLAEGRVRAIGVSNFSVAHLADFLPHVQVSGSQPGRTPPDDNQPALRARHAELELQRRRVAAGRRLRVPALRPPRWGERADGLGGHGNRESIRKDTRSGAVAVAFRQRPLGDPEVRPTRTHRREPRRVRLLAIRGRDRRN